MKKQAQTITRMFILLMSILVWSSFAFKEVRAVQTGPTLKVKITGLKSSDGNVHVLLFNQAVGFPTNPTKAYRHLRSKASIGELTITADNLPVGLYAIVAFHDKNSNDELDRSWFGSPKENYGFSNLPSEFCGTPSFQQTSFAVDQGTINLSIQLLNVD